MARIARCVFPHIPHHIVQRGNRRAQVFFTERDRLAYLAWLGGYCELHGVQVLAYCLMTNHVHLVAVPRSKAAFEQVLRPLHMRYAQRVNMAMGWTGHLWQGRYFSSVLDEAYLWTAIRYVERNPVRAQIVSAAEGYRWSSADAHCGRRDDRLLTRDPHWLETMNQVPDWSAWLAQPDPPRSLQQLRKNVQRCWPCGSQAFVGELERRAGFPLGPRPMGRPVGKSNT